MCWEKVDEENGRMDIRELIFNEMSRRAIALVTSTVAIFSKLSKAMFAVPAVQFGIELA
jgi:hypothetical protein